MASNYRYLPFEDRLAPVEQKERKTIPTNSPYIVRLGEAPHKTAPSTMIVKEITGFDSEGEPIYGATLTEVSAPPAQGEFYPDYYTGADGDPNWNTGQIMFNAADAGKLLEIIYNGIGSIVWAEGGGGVEWQTDRGDGRDGAFAPTSNITLSGTFYNFASVNIPAGVTVTIANGGYIKCLGTFTNNGTITANGRGASGGGGGNYNSGGGAGSNGDASNGGSGGAGDVSQISATSRGSYAGGAGGHISTQPIDDEQCDNAPLYNLRRSGGGGGGGAYIIPEEEQNAYSYGGGGGAGGGSIVIVAQVITNNGTITANGNNGGNGRVEAIDFIGAAAGGGGGGGGGIIQLVADTIIQGTLTANGGTGGAGVRGSSGIEAHAANGSPGANGKVWVKRLA